MKNKLKFLFIALAAVIGFTFAACDTGDTHVHKWNDGVQYSAQTCTVAKKMKYTCIDCGGESIVETGLPAGHNRAASTTSKPWCGDGQKCDRANCNQKLPALPHRNTSVTGTCLNYTCGYCGTSGHNSHFPLPISIDPHAITPKIACTSSFACGGCANLSAPALGHNYNSTECIKCFALKPGYPPEFDYRIIKSGSNFITYEGSVQKGTAPEIQMAINSIQTVAGTNDCKITFDNGTNALDIGNTGITFSGTWGNIELAGKITSSVSTNINSSTITITNTNVTSYADIENTGSTYGSAINVSGNSNLTISGGNIIANQIAVRANVNNTGKIIIEGDETFIMSYKSNAVFSNGNGAIEIRGEAYIYSELSYAIFNDSTTGKVTIFEEASVSSEENAIYNRGILNINGGYIFSFAENVVPDTGIITNLGSLIMTDGAISGEVTAIRGIENGTISISGGSILSETTYAIDAESYTTTPFNTKITLAANADFNFPLIEGLIRPSMGSGKGNLSATGIFNNKFDLEYDNYVNNMVVVQGGASYVNTGTFVLIGGAPGSSLKAGGTNNVDLIYQAP